MQCLGLKTIEWGTFTSHSAPVAEPNPSSVVNVMEFADSVPGGFRLDILPRNHDGVSRIFVRFDKYASDSERQSSLDLNLSCLNRPFRCRDAYDLAPSLPKRPEARSLLPNSDD